ncbi:hypothetical protein ACJQWK_00271 [Exserohilum turcicum]
MLQLIFYKYLHHVAYRKSEIIPFLTLKRTFIQENDGNSLTNFFLLPIYSITADISSSHDMSNPHKSINEENTLSTLVNILISQPYRSISTDHLHFALQPDGSFTMTLQT